MHHASKTRRASRVRVGIVRRALSFTAAFTATMVVLSLLGSRARAELHEPLRAGTYPSLQPLSVELAVGLLPRASLMPGPFLMLLPIGISGRASFRTSTHTPKRTMVTFGDDDSLCLGARCAPRLGSRLTLEPGVAERSGSTHAVESIGIGKAALKLFSTPVPKRTAAYAFGVSPMFACSGAGLEMRLAWW